MILGTIFERCNTVTCKDLALQQGSGNLAVLATPRLLAWLEECCWRAVAEKLADEETTVGTSVDLRHVAASGLGAYILCRAELIGQECKRLRFKVEAFEGAILLAEGELERFIVNSEQFVGKVLER